jgi:hypothetical protein
MGTGEALDKAKESNQYIAVFDTATQELTGLQQGEILLKVESNATTAEKIISIQ